MQVEEPQIQEEIELSLYKRIKFFARRYSYSWLGFWLQKDYHDIILSLTILTFEVGCSYTRKKANFKVSKNSWGWDWIKI